MKLPKIYTPKEYEENIYALWEKTNTFTPKDRGANETYSIVMPPPNANADIHMGTAITLGLEDIAIRYHRMLGKKTLFLPGADHAGFETQSVYEKHLTKEGKSRFDFTREELYKQIFDFVEENKKLYEVQFRRLGASADWTRYTYTLDNHIIERAYETFKKMWDEGLIYRGERLVNFCTKHGTGFADIEVEHEEQKGSLWYIDYPLSDGSGHVTVATTRPETMLGDTAVAVHPDDKKYAKFIGKTVSLPLSDREIPIIADEMVETEFGTGAVKITPAHDPNDFALAERHDLPMISVIGEDGNMTENAGEYRGLSVKDAREKVVTDLKQAGVLSKTEDHTHSVGVCYKCKTTIEPLLKEQWFVNMSPLAERAIEALKKDEIKFHPSQKKDQLITYLGGLRDWNISRQQAWGVPIPAFQNVDDPSDWIFDDRVGEEFIEVDGKKYHRDPEIFDTWFTSSSWPYATLNFPDSDDFNDFYPLSVMETGGEILYPWVARMIMLGLYVTDQVPFKEVYIHGYVMAQDGSKMSKSIGNVINPLPVMEEFGSDALRMGIVAGRAPAINRGYDPTKVAGYRNFCNKIWNIARFIEDIVGDDPELRHEAKPITNADHWVLGKINEGITKTTKDLEEYRFAEALDTIYHLVWNDIADWYIEAEKTTKNKAMLAYVLETILKLAHPFAPFLTETIWQTLKWEKDSILAVAPWPKAPEFDAKRADDFDFVREIVTEIRYITTTLKARDTHLEYKNEDVITHNKDLIMQLARLKSVTEKDGEEGITLTISKVNARVIVDPKLIKKYVEELKKNLKQQSNVIEGLDKRLSNKSYVSNAPKDIVDETKAQLDDNKDILAGMQSELNHFSK
ncbi:MAG: valine--tRNA ligase [bacterium]|nr:valine--tRNA ligase [bacterium]